MWSGDQISQIQEDKCQTITHTWDSHWKEHTHMHMYTHTQMHTYTHIHIQMHTHTHTQMYTHTHTNAHTHTHTHTLTSQVPEHSVYTHIHTHTCSHTHSSGPWARCVHTHINTHTHTHSSDPCALCVHIHSLLMLTLCYPSVKLLGKKSTLGSLCSQCIVLWASPYSPASSLASLPLMEPRSRALCIFSP